MSHCMDDAFCPYFHHAIELIGRRWTGVVLRSMLNGATRFNDIAAAVPNLSDKMLCERLKELEMEGVITRTVVPEIPVRVEYELTEKGRALEGVLLALDDWADRWVALEAPPPQKAKASPTIPAPAPATRKQPRPQAARKPRRR